MRRKLYELAHSRAGDKGDTSILSVIAYRPEDFPVLREQVTANAVKQHLAGIVTGEVRRFELPHLAALQFVCEHSLSGGVTTSLALDTHGKSLSSALLELEIELA
ncbi:MAG: hypothetical protein NVS2B9_05110 [Myxococcales bacterium]